MTLRLMTSTFTKRLLGLVFLALIAASTTNADPLTFSNVVALQNSGATRVDLFQNPGASLLGPEITFLVDLSGDLPVSGLDILQITFAEAGHAPIVQTFKIPIFDGVSLPYSQIFSVSFLNATAQGTGASLTVDILGSSADFVIPRGPGEGQRVNAYTYTFVGVQPVPEPGSLILLGLGLSSFSAQGYRTLRKRVRKLNQ